MIKVFDSYLNRAHYSVQEQAPLLKKYGMDGIGTTREMFQSMAAAREAGKCAADYGLKWHCIHPPVDLLTENTSDEEFDANLEVLKHWCEMGEKIGVKLAYNRIWSGSNFRCYDEAFEWNVLRVRQIQRVTGEFGIRYALEWIGPERVKKSFKFPFLNTLSGVLAIADEANRDVGFIFDTFHWHCGGGTMADVYYAAANCDRMLGFHINDAAPVPLDQQEDKVRALPLQNGVIDASIPYKIFKRAGYNGPLMTEPFLPTVSRYENMPLEDIIREIAEATDRVIRKAEETSFTEVKA